MIFCRSKVGTIVFFRYLCYTVFITMACFYAKRVFIVGFGISPVTNYLQLDQKCNGTYTIPTYKMFVVCGLNG